MKKKICPICDQIMSSNHYCRTCRTWIKQPFEREADFYLNERHPGNESLCEYHDRNLRQTLNPSRPTSPTQIYADQDLNRQLYGTPTSQEPVSTLRPPQPQQSYPYSGSAPNGKSNGAVIVIAAAIGIIVLIAVGTALLGGIYKSVAGQIGSSFYEYGFNDSFTEDGDSSEEDYRVLEDEEVIAEGVNCNSFTHFQMKEDEMTPAIIASLQSAGYQITSEYTDSYNDATMEEDELTYYNTEHVMYAADRKDMAIRDDMSQWVGLDYDTATGDLHMYSSNLMDMTKSIVIMIEFIKGIESCYGVPDTESCVPKVSQEMRTKLDTVGEYTFESDQFYITGQSLEDGISIFVYCNEEDRGGFQ